MGNSSPEDPDFLYRLRSVRVFLISLGLGLLFGFIDALADYFFFYPDDPLRDIFLTNVPAHEIWVRGLFLLFFIGFGAFAQWRVNSERRLRQELNERHREKEDLLREMNHRVKNNLQVVSGLVGLQAASNQQEAASRALRHVGMKLDSIAQAHKHFYRDDALRHLNLSDYLRDLLDRVIRADGRSPVESRFEGDEVRCSLDAAVPVGLILTELVGNALEHAFPESETEGVISVRLEALDGGGFRLHVEDNGIGSTVYGNDNAPTGTGLRLARGLAKQIEAELAVTADQGTRATLTLSGGETCPSG